jgi:DNA-binding NtrC family response regulator
MPFLKLPDQNSRYEKKPKGKGKMANILIVDDQKWVIDLFSDDLVGEGHKIFATDDVNSVRENVFSFNPDRVLLNLYLKAGFTVWDVLQDIKKQDPHLPVVIVTAYDTYLYDPRLSKANGHVIKTCFAPNELKEKITHALSQKANIQQKSGAPFVQA